MKFLKRYFSNDAKNLKKYNNINKKVLEMKGKISVFTDKEIQQSFKKIQESNFTTTAVSEEDLVKLLSICSIASKRILELEPFEAQLLGIQSIIDGKIIEMKTGEGKTLVAGLAAIIGSIIFKNSFVVTVNDYLSKRDKEFIEPLAEFFGLTIGHLSKDDTYEEKRKIYESNLIYATNSTLAFDYLKENLIYDKRNSFLGGYGLVIIDEIDSILIDEARTPLIISGNTTFQRDFYIQSFQIAERLIDEVDFKKEKETKNIILTEAGINKIEQTLGIDKLYVHKNINWAHQILQSLQAIYFFQNEIDYITDGTEIKIIDEFNGRITEGRRWGSGLHQAIEVKEGVEVQEDSSSLAEITYQSFFKLFSLLTGMSGTVKEEEKEFNSIYNKEIIQIPTNKPIIRTDKDDILFHSTEKKYEYLLKKVKKIHSRKQPILIGTISVEQSEAISKIFEQNNLKHEVLNAKNHLKEAKIIQKAGQLNAITIATNMAGRGVDIKLSDEVKELGGLYIFGFERYQNRRIDNQLIGRGGRQGEPGETVFLLSLEDHILSMSKNPLYDTLKAQLEKENNGTKFKMLTKVIKNQQQKISNINMEQRKNLYKYDKILATNRNHIYNMRKEILSFDDVEENKSVFKDKISQYIKETIPNFINLKSTKYSLKEIGLHDFGSILEENTEVSELMEIIERDCHQKVDMVDTLTTQQIFLELLDNHWRDFLDKTSILRQGIHLRGYNHKDPVVEFQTEAQIMFSQLVPKVKIEIVKALMFFEPEGGSAENNADIKEMEIIKTLEMYNVEVEDSLKVLLTEEVDFENTLQNYIAELVGDVVNEDMYNNVSEHHNLLQEFHISKDTLGEMKNNTENLETFNRLMTEKIYTSIQENLQRLIDKGELNSKKALYKDIFVGSLENNHNLYLNSLKTILTDNRRNSEEILRGVKEEFLMIYLNTKFDIIMSLLNINEILQKKEAND